MMRLVVALVGLMTITACASSPGAALLPQVAASSGPLDFGRLARVCDVSKSDLGSEVDAQAGFKLFDTNPEKLTPRTHYVTGLRDGCALKFTAGLAVFGSPGLHEKQRYQSRSGFSATDTAYELIKSAFCRVKSGEPCGARLERLERNTVFISLYRQFGGRVSGDILLHNRQFYASDL